ncbi:hypothetical protein JCM10908_003386 [Rhodotorula pacifica]|uniref:uncharacterized protein n=1 Tax=Rhodotorula pacifica TaxID=1495444 RepID=UPI003179264A
MRSPAVTLAAMPLFALAVSAQGLIDNMVNFNMISDTAVTFDGNYYVQNVKTGKYLYFDRPDDTTNLITGDERRTIQLGHDKAYGQSGREWDHWEGTFFRGLNDKCMSAQWGEHGTDVAGVSYACKVGPGSTGTDSLEVAKQFWKLVVCGKDDNNNNGGEGTSFMAADYKQLAAVESKGGDSSSAKAAETATFEAKQEEAAPTSSPSSSGGSDSAPSQAIDPKDRSTWVCRKDGKWLSEHPEYVTEGGRIECKDELDAYIKEHGKPVDDGIDPNDRSTWVCNHDAQWLSEHPDYVWKAGKIECRQRLLDFYAEHGKKKRSYTTKEVRSLARRRSVAPTTTTMKKRATAPDTYCIAALDHMKDMRTRALTGKTITSFGGYLSVELADWNKNDEAQHWRVIPA